jgi:hypothetical protein
MEFKKGGYIEFEWGFALQTSPRPGGEERRPVGEIMTDRERAMRRLEQRVKITLYPGWRWRHRFGRGIVPERRVESHKPKGYKKDD